MPASTCVPYKSYHYPSTWKLKWILKWIRLLTLTVVVIHRLRSSDADCAVVLISAFCGWNTNWRKPWPGSSGWYLQQEEENPARPRPSQCTGKLRLCVCVCLPVCVCVCVCAYLCMCVCVCVSTHIFMDDKILSAAFETYFYVHMILFLKNRWMLYFKKRLLKKPHTWWHVTNGPEGKFGHTPTNL